MFLLCHGNSTFQKVKAIFVFFFSLFLRRKITNVFIPAISDKRQVHVENKPLTTITNIYTQFSLNSPELSQFCTHSRFIQQSQYKITQVVDISHYKKKRTHQLFIIIAAASWWQSHYFVYIHSKWWCWWARLWTYIVCTVLRSGYSV